MARHQLLKLAVAVAVTSAGLVLVQAVAQTPAQLEQPPPSVATFSDASPEGYYIVVDSATAEARAALTPRHEQ
jgi:hypothetical protein